MLCGCICIDVFGVVGCEMIILVLLDFYVCYFDI